LASIPYGITVEQNQFRVDLSSRTTDGLHNQGQIQLNTGTGGVFLTYLLPNYFFSEQAQYKAFALPPTGYEFAGWSVEGDVHTSDNASATTLYVVGSGSLVVVYRPVTQGAPVQSGWTSMPLILDGNALDPSWYNATVIPARFGSVLVMNNVQKLYALIDSTADNHLDPRLSYASPGDYFWTTFDIDRNGELTSNVDVNYGLWENLPSQLCLSYLLTKDSWSGCYQPKSRLAEGFGNSILSNGSHEFYELEFDLSELHASPGSLVAFDVLVNSQTPSFTLCIQDCWTGAFPIHLTQVQLAQKAPSLKPNTTTRSVQTEQTSGQVATVTIGQTEASRSLQTADFPVLLGIALGLLVSIPIVMFRFRRLRRLRWST
jgi:hypothetical protein